MKLSKILMLGAFCLAGNVGFAAAPAASPAAAAATATAAPAAAAAAHVTGAGQALSKADLDAWLDGYMPFALQSTDIPGAVVTVVKDGKIVTSRGFGYADIAKNKPVDPDRTLFRPGSVSKLVTWTAVMQQVEQKKLDLDTDVNTYLDFKIPARNGVPVTLRQIMTHTAGFEEQAKNIIFYDAGKLQSLGDSLKAWVPNRIFDAGTTPAYSNYATALAGYIVERVSGEKFDDYVERHVFAPLGMKNTTFRQPLPAAMAPHMSVGYKAGKPDGGFEIVGPAPAGSMSSTGNDMGRYMIANLQLGELDGKRIMTEATANAMFDTPLSSVNPRSVVGPLNRMELGFFETNINGRKVIGHLGDTVAFHTSLHLFMKEGAGFYVSFNSGGKAGAANTLRMRMFQDFSDRYFPEASAPSALADAKASAERVRLMSGNWYNSRRSDSSFFAALGLLGQTQVTANANGELVVPALVGANGRPREWMEIAPFVWRDKAGHDRLAAQVVDGKPVRWSMDFMSPFMMFDRVPTGISGAWLKPALIGGLVVLLLTFLTMPFGWFARRKYKVAMPLNGEAKRAYRASQIGAGLTLLVLGGWITAVTLMLGDLKNATSMFDPLLWLLQIAGIVVFSAAILAAVWNMKWTWSEKRSVARKIWSVLLLASSIVVFYAAARFGLLAMQVNY
jgi:CubicO group peptidase (beta-lactamase class C family)